MTTNIATITPTAMPTPSLLLLVELLAVGGSATGMSKTKVNVTKLKCYTMNQIGNVFTNH